MSIKTLMRNIVKKQGELDLMGGFQERVRLFTELLLVIQLT